MCCGRKTTKCYTEKCGKIGVILLEKDELELVQSPAYTVDPVVLRSSNDLGASNWVKCHNECASRGNITRRIYS
jgi:hypothetical protein